MSLVREERVSTIDVKHGSGGSLRRTLVLSNDRVFTSRYVYKLKRSVITVEVYRFKARLIVRGFQMKKGVDFDDSFSPTPGLAVGRIC